MKTIVKKNSISVEMLALCKFFGIVFLVNFYVRNTSGTTRRMKLYEMRKEKEKNFILAFTIKHKGLRVGTSTAPNTRSEGAKYRRQEL